MKEALHEIGTRKSDTFAPRPSDRATQYALYTFSPLPALVILTILESLFHTDGKRSLHLISVSLSARSGAIFATLPSRRHSKAILDNMAIYGAELQASLEAVLLYSCSLTAPSST